MKKGALKKHGLILVLLLCVDFVLAYYSKELSREGIKILLVEAIIMWITIIFCIAFIVEVFQYCILYCGKLAKQKGFPESCKWFGLLLIIGIIILMWATPPKERNGTIESAADEIMKYKELYSQGAITKEEFVKKKSELLSQMPRPDGRDI